VAREVERWLADEPVTAYREPILVRLARWGRRHRTLVTASGVVLLTLLGAAVVGGVVVGREHQRARALAQADALADAGPATVPALLKDLEADRDTVRPRLWARWQDPALTDGQRLRLGLALGDDAEVRARLVALARTADDPQEVLLVRDALAPYAAEVAPLPWRPVGEPNTPSRDRFRLLAILATLDAKSDRWEGLTAYVVSVLVRENVLLLSGWAAALRPVGDRLIPPLTQVFRDASRPESERSVAASLLADYAADRPDVLADLLTEADEPQWAVLWPRLQPHGERAAKLMQEELQKPMPPEDQVQARDQLARRQAQAAVALLQLGREEAVWPLFRHSPEHSPDPSRRTYLLHRLGPLNVDPRALLRRLDNEPDVSARRALILSLGEYTSAQLPEGVRGPLTAKLLRWYRDDPDPGVHSAIDWLLRHGTEGPTPRKLDWGQADALARIDAELALLRSRPQLGGLLAGAATGPLHVLPGLHLGPETAAAEANSPRPRWYVNGQGQTMAVIPGPAEFRMGSPAWEPGRAPDEAQHLRKIPRSYALAVRPVTWPNFSAFWKPTRRSRSGSTRAARWRIS
jgi:hypothetical protein